MSMHKIPLTPLEEQGLCAHGLPVGQPSQLADSFRQGMAWALRAQPDDMYETRQDGKRVHKARWEVGIRRIVALLWGNEREFEIDEVVEAVRALLKNPNLNDEGLVKAAMELPR